MICNSPHSPVQLQKPFEDFKSPSRVVLSLMIGFYDKGYSLELNNLYTSPELLKALYHCRTDAYGTLRSKKGLPPNFWKWAPVKGVGAWYSQVL